MSDENRQNAAASFSGRARRRSTSRTVHVANRVAGLLITLGGSATILTISLVCVFLLWVVIPVFLPPKLDPGSDIPAPSDAAGPGEVPLRLNEYLTMAWSLNTLGVVRLVSLDTGELLSELKPLGDRVPTAVSSVSSDGLIAFGFGDGSIQYGKIGFATRFLDAQHLPPKAEDLDVGGRMSAEGGVVERTPEGQYRLQTIGIALEEPVEIEAGTRIELLDISGRADGRVVAALTSSNTLHVDEITSKKNLITRKTTVKKIGGSIKLDIAQDEVRPAWLKLTGLGDNAMICWRDGRLLRYDTRDVESPQFLESVFIVAEPDAQVTALEFLIGKTSLVVGDSRGRVRVWFRTHAEGAVTNDGRVLTMAHELAPANAAVSAIAVSARGRMIAAGYADGTVRLSHITSERLLAEVNVDGGGVAAVALGPKDDALAAASAAHILLWHMDVPHPEITPAAILTPVWYEGSPAPAHVWQSSSGTDDFEPKYGLYPLVFGTLKATMYSMLFGVPAALLAAVYTSEMMGRRARMRVKPVIEMMASLPSVVLGFLAALVVAPWIEQVVPASLLAFVTIPFAILFGAHLWQLLPRRFATRHDRWRIVFVGAAIVVGVWLAIALGPVVERVLFANDIRAWLDGQVGTGTGGWMMLLLPLACLVFALTSGRFVNPWFLGASAGWSDFKIGAVRLALFLGLSAGTVLGALLVSYLLANGPGGLWAFDPRGGFVDTYVQRNAFVVGFIMGFAIIPIIYTISEDALSAVPDHLRTASLGSGATPWQTAVRIIIPTAASGLFSAVMIGFGRAVGETMIVLMAAGNTPVMEWNIFNGFRTLSANIAVELPEAVRDSTHYRMLFLAALSLFAITFVLNTVAETIRQRFRKRAYQI